MRSNLRVLLSTLLCISLATAGSGAQAEILRGASAAPAYEDRLVAHLVAHGVDAAQAEARVAALTHDEAALLASKFDELPAAGGGGDGLLALVAFAAVVYVVIKLLPFILIGGGAVAAIKASDAAASRCEACVSDR